MYGQLVIGPPGSGKSTYCAAMRAALAASGRKVAIVNLDPANEQCECDVDVRDLVSEALSAHPRSLSPRQLLALFLSFSPFSAPGSPPLRRPRPIFLGLPGQQIGLS